jgi:hypothetical protein
MEDKCIIGVEKNLRNVSPIFKFGDCEGGGLFGGQVCEVECGGATGGD